MCLCLPAFNIYRTVILVLLGTSAGGGEGPTTTGACGCWRGRQEGRGQGWDLCLGGSALFLPGTLTIEQAFFTPALPTT